MGIYTVYENPEADLAVQKALGRITDGIIDLMGNHLDAIVLTGSFGRGEGGVFRQNGKFRPVNDFDITVIVSRKYFRVKKRFSRPLVDLVKKLAHETGVKQIDIGISHPLRFRFAPNLVASYEERDCHQVLWGHIDLKTLMPSLPAERLPLLDGAIYFLSRGSGLLIPALYFLSTDKVQQRYRENFQIELDKACLAMGDALLLLRKQYHYSYRERLRRLQEADLSQVPEGEIIRHWYVTAMQRKLIPAFSWNGDEAMIDRWYQIRDIFGRFFLWFEEIRLERSFCDWEEYSIFVEKHVRDPLGHRLRIWIRSTIQLGVMTILGPRGREVRLYQSRQFRWATMPMLLFSLKPYGLNLNMLCRGRKLLGLKKLDGTEITWQDAVRQYLKGFHPEGVIREMLEGEDT